MMRISTKEIKLATDEPYLRVMVGFLNHLFGKTEDSKRYWKSEFRWSLEQNYFYISNSLRKVIHDIDKLKAKVDLPIMFERVLERLGAQVTPDLLTRAAFPSFFQQEMVVDERDFKGLIPVVTSGLTDHPKAFLLYQQV